MGINDATCQCQSPTNWFGGHPVLKNPIFKQTRPSYFLFLKTGAPQAVRNFQPTHPRDSQREFQIYVIAGTPQFHGNDFDC